jgi:hypothetical protein
VALAKGVRRRIILPRPSASLRSRADVPEPMRFSNAFMVQTRRSSVRSCFTVEVRPRERREEGRAWTVG